MKKLLTALLTTLLALSIAQNATDPEESTNMTLREAAEKRGFFIGTAVHSGFFGLESSYMKTLNQEFNMIVAENSMKWGTLNSGGPGEYNFSTADLMVESAIENKQTMRGHTLVWHQQAPSWINSVTDKDELTKYMTDHIKKVIERYKGKIEIWDVVNEAISDGGGMRHSQFYDVIGQDYIDIAFKTAHEADPKAKLFYNDYSIDALNQKSDEVYEMIKGMLARGIPVHGVGFQAHVDINFSAEQSQLRENLQRFADLGLEIQFTEVDVLLKGTGSTESKLEEQARVYGEMLEACLAVRECTAFVMWGFTDGYSWRAASDPLIFDWAYQKKPAYFKLLEILSR